MRDANRGRVRHWQHQSHYSTEPPASVCLSLSVSFFAFISVCPCQSASLHLSLFVCVCLCFCLCMSVCVSDFVSVSLCLYPRPFYFRRAIFGQPKWPVNLGSVRSIRGR